MVTTAKAAPTDSSTTKKSQFNWPRIFGYDFFISFKLGSPPIGAQSYASDLARRLRELDYTVFFSEEEAPPGEQLDSTLISALNRSRILVVIANEGALVNSLWVRKEVEQFRQKHPKRSVIPINIGQAIETYGLQAETSLWLGQEGRIWLDDSKEAVLEGITSQEVLQRLVLTPRFARSNTRLRWVLTFVIVSLLGLAAWAGYEAWDANRKFKDATAIRLTVEGGAINSGTRTGEMAQGLLKVLAGHRLFPSATTDEALQTEFLRFKQLLHVWKTSTPITTIAFSPDGQRIVSGSEDTTLRLWDATTGKPIGQPLEGHEGDVMSVAFSPDGRRIVSGSEDSTLRLWDTATGKAIGQPLRGHTDAVSSVAFSPDGQCIVSGSDDHRLLLWDTATGKAIGQPLRGHSGVVYSVAFSPDGQRIVSASDDQTLRLWPVFEGWVYELCKKLGRNMSQKEWNEWVSPDIGYIEQCPGLPIPPDEAEAVVTNEK